MACSELGDELGQVWQRRLSTADLAHLFNGEDRGARGKGEAIAQEGGSEGGGGDARGASLAGGRGKGEASGFDREDGGEELDGEDSAGENGWASDTTCESDDCGSSQEVRASDEVAAAREEMAGAGEGMARKVAGAGEVLQGASWTAAAAQPAGAMPAGTTSGEEKLTQGRRWQLVLSNTPSSASHTPPSYTLPLAAGHNELGRRQLAQLTSRPAATSTRPATFASAATASDDVDGMHSSHKLTSEPTSGVMGETSDAPPFAWSTALVSRVQALVRVMSHPWASRRDACSEGEHRLLRSDLSFC